MSFYAATVNDDGSIWLRYDVFNQHAYRASLYIYEKSIENNAPPILTIGASANIIQTQVDTTSGAVLAEYVQGDWSVAPSFTQPQSDSTTGEMHDVWKWDNVSSSQRLRWQQNGVFIALYYQPYRLYSVVIGEQESNSEWIYLSSLLSQGDILQIASEMTPYLAMNSVKTSYKPGGNELIPSSSIDTTGIVKLCPTTSLDIKGSSDKGMVVNK
jgi:hypothetical protein